MQSTYILGAGLSGLIAAHRFPGAQVIDAAPRRPGGNHRAVLRFRSDAISKITRIPFVKVTVRKAIFDGQRLTNECNLQLANMYSLKVAGRVEDRSIWNLESDTRWIAPHDFADLLADQLASEGRIAHGRAFEGDSLRADNIISTIPLPRLLAALRLDSLVSPQLTKSRPVWVYQFQLHNINVYQTIYVPDLDDIIYRASITGDRLIVECIDQCDDLKNDVDQILGWFGIYSSCEFIGEFCQDNGKIVTMPASERHAILHELTVRHGIYSLGRFATWRNVMLDHLVQDMDFIERLMGANSYGKAMLSHGK